VCSEFCHCWRKVCFDFSENVTRVCPAAPKDSVVTRLSSCRVSMVYVARLRPHGFLFMSW
ncbi:mannosidase 2, alpha 2, isoform CRA_b, partial [Mus musculus]